MKLALPVGVVFIGINADGFVGAAMVFKVGLRVAIKVGFAKMARARDRRFKDTGEPA